MKELTVFSVVLLAIFIWSAAIFHADAQNYYVVPRNEFQEGYDAACPGCRNGNAAIANAILFSTLLQRNQQEFQINMMRAQRGLPPCTMAPLFDPTGQGRPRCY